LGFEKDVNLQIILKKKKGGREKEWGLSVLNLDCPKQRGMICPPKGKYQRI
jgi:hypothetical protein